MEFRWCLTNKKPQFLVRTSWRSLVGPTRGEYGFRDHLVRWPTYSAHVNLLVYMWDLATAWVFFNIDVFYPQVPQAVEGTADLGSAVGSDPRIVSVVRQCLVKIKDLLFTIRSLKDEQLEYILLHFCAGLPVFIIVARAMRYYRWTRITVGNYSLSDRELDQLRLAAVSRLHFGWPNVN